METIYHVNRKIENAELRVIYGCGTSGERLLSQLLYDDIRVDFFCDSNSDMWGTKVLNKPVISPEKLLELNERCVVLISSIYCEEIYESLSKMGIKNIFLTHKDLFGQPKK